MNLPMKVLLVQRQPDQGRLQQWLEHESALDFEWRRLYSESELRATAGDYAPSVVLCADDMRAGAPRAIFDLLCMLSRQPPQLMVCEVCEESAPWSSAAADITAPWLRPAFADSAELATLRVPDARRDSPATPAERPRLPAVLRSSLDAVLMLDDQGWVTDLNPHAQKLLGIGRGQRPKAQAHLQDLIGALHVAGEGRSTTLPLVALNLDGLLLLNAPSGEQFGDAALDLIASVVQPQFARCGLLARVGVNQYLAIVPHMSPSADAAVSVGGVRRAYAERNLSMVFGTTSINDANLRQPPQQPSPRVHHAAPARAMDLSAALERQALDVHFQPQYELAGGRGCGAEALVRWPLSSGGSLAPGEFIPLAERSGSLGALDAWVLKTACSAALRWRGPGAEHLTLAVNVSDRQLGAHYPRMLAEVLRAVRFPAQRLELEIGEGPIIANSAQVEACLKECKQLGVRIAVCHRTGNYSTLDYLARNAVDRLKLDKSLIHRMTHDRSMASTVRAIIALCAELNVEVIAEGVETHPQLAMLRDFDCPRGQGFLLARPMPALQAQVVLGKTWGNLPVAVTQDRRAAAHQ